MDKVDMDQVSLSKEISTYLDHHDDLFDHPSDDGLNWAGNLCYKLGCYVSPKSSFKAKTFIGYTLLELLSSSTVGRLTSD